MQNLSCRVFFFFYPSHIKEISYLYTKDRYPHALYFLDLLQHAQFRDYVSTSENTQELHRMQYYHWQYLRNPPKSSSPSAVEELMALKPESDK